MVGEAVTWVKYRIFAMIWNMTNGDAFFLRTKYVENELHRRQGHAVQGFGVAERVPVKS